LKLLISYDLNSIEDADGLDEFMKKKFPNYWHGLHATWIVASTLSPVQIRDSMKSFLKSSDGLLVMDITGSFASWRGFNAEPSNWLKSNL
jgi:hypothetical protein